MKNDPRKRYKTKYEHGTKPFDGFGKVQHTSRHGEYVVYTCLNDYGFSYHYSHEPVL